MIPLKTISSKNDFEKVGNLVTSGEKILISRPHNQNLVIISEKEYNELNKARRNAEYLAMLDESHQQLSEGKTYTFTMDELFAMEDMTAAEMQAFAEGCRGQKT